MACFHFSDSGAARKILVIEMNAMSRFTPAAIALGRLGIDFELVVYDRHAAGPMTAKKPDRGYA
jgi:hypothetical protein